jgi:malonate decarboxylase alpha subunit
MSEGRASGKGHETPHRDTIEPMRSSWLTRREDKARRLERVAKVARGRVLPTEEIVPALEALVAPGDRVVLEGNNQKQADFLSRSLAAVDPEKVHDLHMLISSISRPDHLDLFERDIATLVDFSYAGPQSLRVAQLLDDGKPTVWGWIA